MIKSNIIRDISQPNLSSVIIYTELFEWYKKHQHTYFLIHGYDPVMRKETREEKFRVLKALWDMKFNMNKRYNRRIEKIPYGYNFKSSKKFATYLYLFEVFDVHKDKRGLKYCSFNSIKS